MLSRAGFVAGANLPLTFAGDVAAMARPVLLLNSDPLTQLLVGSGLQGYGYEVVAASSVADAQGLLQSRRIGVLVADVDTDAAGRLSFVRAARAADPSLAVVYTARVPSKLADREKVRGAPCLRTPYHPHQLVSLIGHLFRRGGDDEESSDAA